MDSKEEKKEEYYKGKEVKGKLEKEEGTTRARKSKAKNSPLRRQRT